MGGNSSESDISLLTGDAIVSGLREAGYNVTPVILSKEDNSFTLPENADAVYIALHGEFGEGGSIQHILREKNIPYTGCNEEASKIGFDKILSREAFQKNNVSIPKGYVIDTSKGIPDSSELPLPVVVKPPRQGSSVGVSIVKTESDFNNAVTEAAKYGKDVLVEDFIPGRELSVSIVCGKVLPPVEITPKSAWYNWQAKYQSGGTTSYTFPSDTAGNEELIQILEKETIKAFDAIGASTMARVDFRVTPNGEVYALEINTIPGCTKSSLLPKAAAKVGISFPELCSIIIEDAKCR